MMARKYQSTVVSEYFKRHETISSSTRFSRYGKFKDCAYAMLSCGHESRLDSLRIKDDGTCLCFDCKYEDLESKQ